MTKIILATTSPYRKKLFKELGIDFVAEGSNVEERFDGRPDDPEELVGQLSKLKAEAVAKKHQEGIVIGFDSVGWIDGEPLEKPKSREEAIKRLKLLSGRTHWFYTGIYMIDAKTGKFISRVVKSEIKLRKISNSEIDRYLDQDPNYNTYAIGFDPIGHYSSTFAIDLIGSYNNFIWGIPLETIVEMLPELDYKL